MFPSHEVFPSHDTFVVNIIGGVITLGLCLLFIGQGINGMGIGWLIGQTITGLIFLFLLKKEIS